MSARLNHQTASQPSINVTTDELNDIVMSANNQAPTLGMYSIILLYV